MEIELNRIILFGMEIDKLKTFYHTHFNFIISEEIKNEWVVLKAGRIEIAFHKIGDEFLNTIVKPFKVNSNTKLVFEMTGDMSAFRQKLLGEGVCLTELNLFKIPRYISCEGEDPEGNIFQLKQLKE